MLMMTGKKQNPSIPLCFTNYPIMFSRYSPGKFGFAALFVLFVLEIGCSSPKQVSKTDTQTLQQVCAHISYLANDRLEGRRTGTNGEKLAMEYIRQQFNTIGLAPKGSDGYFQAFDVYDGKTIGDSTRLNLNGVDLVPDKEFFPFPFSDNQKMKALPSISVQEADMPWFFDLKETLEENKNNPYFDLQGYIVSNSRKAIAKGASALFLYNTSAIDDKLAFDPKDKTEKLSVPVFYIRKEAAIKYFSDPSATIPVKFIVSIGEKKRVGHNVIGYIDNGAPTTVILGAHFDHLGYGEDGNSMIRHFDQPMIHNGADDNASGTAALIELARKLKASKARGNNYLFIAFSGEELGLFGSKYFTDHPTVDLKTVNYMINMDMVGRLNDSTKVLTIGGYGTSPAWSSAFNNNPALTKNNPFVFKYDSSGTGPSDHTSFYRKDIPVLFYFTGLHSDYHKPSDDADKINYPGEVAIIENIQRLVESLDHAPRLAFLKTRETQTGSSARFSVSMGIMPDYTFAGTGVRADGISDGKPAQKAGLKAGDVIIQLGDYTVSSLENYMQALGKFKKGDKTRVKFKRGNEVMEANVEF